MKTPSGITGFDDFLEGGYENSSLNMIYGPGASGKTTFCLCFGIFLAKQGKKVIFIDTENSLSLERISQIAFESNIEDILEKIVIFKPKSFLEQHKLIISLGKTLKKSSIAGIIVDTIGFYYRAQSKEGSLNSHLAKQLSDLKYLSSKKNIPIILTNQVYSDINIENKINLVGGEMVKNWCTYLIELKKNRTRKAVIHKPFKKEVVFCIENKGISIIR